MLLAGIKGSSLTEHQGGAVGMGSWLVPFFPALWTSEVSLRVYKCFPVSVRWPPSPLALFPTWDYSFWWASASQQMLLKGPRPLISAPLNLF